ncbi:DUF2062 domain-containing protein [Sediminicurvatus halobius]|uniref:DUF2062 domain-containing protein n=1 Tax=Sediminicurvatus halobius TaxID=2182432 RepID=A0A2U2N1X0_9GAMM|nr:DUF2062 domain-containing protein [Spiribacter halobius]PWG63225.1 DUF2062 domain-containing protein [Spiribacter halobius]UEX76705.1 DUF2062 domain-containing protein [Spiribacter halobius]
MPRRLLRRYLPEAGAVRHRVGLGFMAGLLEDPFLLHLNRRSVAGGVAVGLFVAFLPVPGQMAIAAALAVLLRVNLVLSVLLVWISNPLTIPPMVYFTYVVGTWLLGSPVVHTAFEPSLAWVVHEFRQIWQPVLLGSLAVGTLVSLAGYGAANLLWRIWVVRELRRRRPSREQAARLRAHATGHDGEGERRQGAKDAKDAKVSD